MVASTAGPAWTRRTTVRGRARESTNPRGSRWPSTGSPPSACARESVESTLAGERL
uniref:6-phosphogluconate dehydrogenase family protein n=1 Tax=Arundo donax TaxID=35708 RepID=A0A0A9CYE7_ARUDO